MIRTRTVRFAAAGLVLSWGAPLGWLGLRLSLGRAAGVGEELERFPALYAYLLFGTGTAFSLFGALAGHLADRLAEANAMLQRLASTDALTGLRNARAYHEEIVAAVARARRDAAPLSLIMVDLDRFKRLNDRFGHAAGDEALAHAAKVVRAGIRTGDVACRVGGEEFAIICPGATAEEAHAVAERIRDALEKAPLAAVGDAPVTASFGVALLAPGLDASSLFTLADRALYAAKEAGRNRVVRAA